MQNHPGRGRLINVGCRWNAGKNRAPAPPGRAYALRAPRSDFREIRGFLRIILPPLHAAPWKKSDGASGKSAATFRLRYANRATRPITLGFGASELENPAGEAEKKEGKGKKRRKRKRKQKRWFARPLASGWTTYEEHRECKGREGGEVERAKKSRECCKNPGPPIGRIVSSR